MDRIDTFTIERTIENVSGPSITVYRALCSRCDFVSGAWTEAGEAAHVAEDHLRCHIANDLQAMQTVGGAR